MNIAEILKYCPKGTKLYSTAFGEVKFISITPLTNEILVQNIHGTSFTFYSNGSYILDGECILFPSEEQRDWDEFRLSVKRGDVMMEVNGKFAFIANGKFDEHNWPIFICGVNGRGTFLTNDKEENFGWTTNFYIPASEEAKKELFDKMAEAGYKWNADTLELEKIESKFKIGDVVVDSKHNLYLVAKVSNNNVIVIAIFSPYDILSVYEQIIYFHTNDMTLASITDRNRLFSALVKNGYKYDKEHNSLKKQEFKLFDKVLVRDNNTDSWKADIYLGYDEECKVYHYKCARANYAICIPYEGNEYLLGTTDSPM